VPLLDEVEERQRALALALAAVALGDVHDEAQVGLDHVRLASRSPALDALGELHLLASVQQRHPADRLEERLEAVGGVGDRGGTFALMRKPLAGKSLSAPKREAKLVLGLRVLR
jgi:hypothetical protein